MSIKKPEFRIRMASDVDYPELIAEVFVEEKFLALVHFVDSEPVVDFPGPKQFEPALIRSVPYETLVLALAEAVTRLTKRLGLEHEHDSS